MPFMAAQFLRSSDTCQLHQSRPLDAVLYNCGATVHHNSYNVS